MEIKAEDITESRFLGSTSFHSDGIGLRVTWDTVHQLRSSSAFPALLVQNHEPGILQEREGETAADGEVQLIDFEYSGSSYATFDIANHFCEYAGFECDYSRFPDDAHIATFMRTYLVQDSAEPVVSHAVCPSPDACLLDCGYPLLGR